MRFWKVLLCLPLCLSLSYAQAQVSEPSPVQNDPAFEAAADYSARRNHDAFLVYRDGVLVYETYRDFGQDERHDLYSGTKSFSCAIAVRAQMDGLLTLDEPVAQTIEEWQDDAVRAEITIRQLLSLTSGLPGSDRGPAAFRRIDAADVSINRLELIGTPGEVFAYGPSHYFVFGELMRRKLDGENAWDYLTRTVLDPLGITVIPALDGGGNVDLSAFAQTTAREWARYGQLILQDGAWDGETLLDPALLRECFLGSAANVQYGLTWWLNIDAQRPVDIDTQRPVADSADDGIVVGETLPEVIVAGGAFDQRLFIIPSLKLVAVRFAGGSFRYSDAELIRLLVQGAE